VAVALVAIHPKQAAPVAAAPKAPSVVATVSRSVVNLDGPVTNGIIAGTGMLLSSSGLVLTNNHVVASTESLSGQVDGTGRVYSVNVIGVDPTADVALVQLVGASGLPTVTIDASASATLGEHVTGLGNAGGLNGAPIVTSGKVTSLDQTIPVSDEEGDIHETLNGVIQFDADVEPGDSGGPLIDDAGQVIGMDTAASNHQGSPLLGNASFAIPIGGVMNIVQQIESGASSPYLQSGHRGILGVSVNDASGTDPPLVTTVVGGGPADDAGVVGGDLITSVDGIPVSTSDEFNAEMQNRRPGSTVLLGWRSSDGRSHQATITLGSGPPE
jgi:S1-C subfamily serine protease